MTRFGFGVLILALLSVSPGCKPREQAGSTAPPTPDQAQSEATDSSSAGAANATEAISSARESLKAGNVADAAARLAIMQAQGTSFDSRQAKDYRQALSEAYDRAYEAVQRGDPKGQEALQLLRAAAPR